MSDGSKHDRMGSPTSGTYSVIINYCMGVTSVKKLQINGSDRSSDGSASDEPECLKVNTGDLFIYFI